MLPLSDPNYTLLAQVLGSAFDQAQSGKGAVRHASGEPFEKQKICEIAKRVGIGGPAFQVVKKTEEAVRLCQRGEHDQAIEDLLGAINYAAAMVILIQEMKTQENFNKEDPDDYRDR